ncbi:MAG: hypothetical protein AAF943_12450 [Pseudomonadota bacterium]
MRGAAEIEEKIESVRGLLHAKLGLRKRELSVMLARAGRRLPRRVHGQAQVLLQARAQAQHPKLAQRLDHVAITRAYEDTVAHLRAIDLAERRKDRLLGIAGSLAFNLLLFGVLLVSLLRWQGHV